MFFVGALKMLGNLVESLKSVDKAIGDAVYYWEEFIHKRQMSEASTQHVGRMFRSAKIKEKSPMDYNDEVKVETERTNMDIFRRKPKEFGGWVDGNNIVQ